MTLKRNHDDPLAPIREVFRKVNEKFDFVLQPEENLTIDEQLLEFYGRVKFRQYISSKPGKYEIKIFWLSKAASEFYLNGLVYIGQGTIPTEAI